MQTINEIQEEILEDFDMFEDWMQKYEYLIDLGKDLPSIEERHKIEDNLIKGCQSRVWLHAEEQNGNIIFSADSDAIMTKGIIALLIRVLSGQSANNIANADLDFINKIGFKRTTFCHKSKRIIIHDKANEVICYSVK